MICPSTADRWASRRVRRRATARASRGATSLETTTNSSPPKRATRSSGSDGQLQPARDVEQHGVARLVAVVIVDRLEVIDVDEQDGQRPGRVGDRRHAERRHSCSSARSAVPVSASRRAREAAMRATAAEHARRSAAPPASRRRTVGTQLQRSERRRAQSRRGRGRRSPGERAGPQPPRRRRARRRPLGRRCAPPRARRRPARPPGLRRSTARRRHTMSRRRRRPPGRPSAFGHLEGGGGYGRVVDRAQASGDGGRLGAAAHAQLGQDVALRRADGVRREAAVAGDLAVGALAAQ